MTQLTKLTSLRGLCLFVILLISISSFSATRPLIPKTNWRNSMNFSVPPGMCIDILNDNMLFITLTIATGPVNIENFPDLYIEYDFGGYLSGTWGPLSSQDFVPIMIGTEPAFEAEKGFYINLEPLCTGPNPAPTPSNPTGFSYSISLVTPTSGGTGTTELYPVLSYPQLFPPSLIDEISNPGFTPAYTGDKDLCCGELATGRNDAETENAIDEIIVKTPSVNLFPNPTNNVLNLEIETEEEEIQIDLIGIDGKVIKAIRREGNMNGNYKEKIEMFDLPKGIYFCRINSENISEVHKVIKL